MNEIRLNLNEMPYPPPENVIEAARNGLSRINRYASSKDMDLLRDYLADYSDVSKERIVVGPGSNLLLREIIHIFSSGKKVIIPNPCFFPIAQCAKDFAAKLLKIQLRPPEFELNVEMIFDEIKEPSLLVIDNPNNPTGKLLIDREMIETILENALLVVDEAYYEFSGITFGEMVEEYPNLSVMRTLDKAFGLAGARIGYLIAGDSFLGAFSTYDAFLPQASLCGAIEALRDPWYVKRNIERVTKERGRMLKELEKLGCQVFGSEANFLLVKTDIPDLVRELYERGVRVSDLACTWLPGYIRVSIGTPEDNDILLSKIGDILP